MSIRSLYKFAGIEKIKTNAVSLTFIRNYSRRSNNDEGPYKVVTIKKPETESNIQCDPNYDLLFQSKGFPFFLPGNIGPAWQDKYSTVQFETKSILKYLPKASQGNVSCQVQECPRVLHKSVCELFPNSSLEHVELSVITLSLQSNIKSMRANKELETEKMAQSFVLAANRICQKIRNAGYWADFINPFSGRPYIQPPKGEMDLYTTDEKFRCLDFQIISINECKIVTNEEDKRSGKKFVGSLFTNAPSKKTCLENIFSDDDS